MLFYGMAYRTKLIIDVTVEASSPQRAQQRWENVLEKIRYQTTNVKLNMQLEPNWMEVSEDGSSDDTQLR